jgi:hypothetical protein
VTAENSLLVVTDSVITNNTAEHITLKVYS